MAFTLRNRHKNEYFEQDARVWGWLPTMIEKGPGQFQKTRPIGVHKCTEKDWAKFPPSSQLDAPQIEFLQKNSVMYCLNEKDTKGQPWRNETLFGTMESDYRSLKIQAYFCRPRGLGQIHNDYQENISWQQTMKCHKRSKDQMSSATLKQQHKEYFGSSKELVMIHVNQRLDSTYETVIKYNEPQTTSRVYTIGHIMKSIIDVGRSVHSL